MANHPTSPQELLNSGRFQDIQRRINFHAMLLRLIQADLPPTAAKHCLHCVAQDADRLLLFTDTQAFASRLRFMAPTLLSKLNASGDFAFKQLTIRQYLADAPVTVPAPPMQAPPAEAIEAVKAISRSVPDDALAQALARLGASMERYAAQHPKKNAADPS